MAWGSHGQLLRRTCSALKYCALVWASALGLSLLSACVVFVTAKLWQDKLSALLQSSWYEPEAHRLDESGWPREVWTVEDWDYRAEYRVQLLVSVAVIFVYRFQAWYISTVVFGAQALPSLAVLLMAYKTPVFLLGLWAPVRYSKLQRILVLKVMSFIMSSAYLPYVLTYNVRGGGGSRLRQAAVVALWVLALTAVVLVVCLLPQYDVANMYARVFMHVVFPSLAGQMMLAISYRVCFSLMDAVNACATADQDSDLLAALREVTAGAMCLHCCIASVLANMLQFGAADYSTAVLQEILQVAMQLWHQRQLFRGELPEAWAWWLLTRSCCCWERCCGLVRRTGIFPTNRTVNLSAIVVIAEPHPVTVPSTVPSPRVSRVSRLSGFLSSWTDDIGSSLPSILSLPTPPEEVLGMLVVLTNVAEPVIVLSTAYCTTSSSTS
eukprot:TRINITY_DN3051_c2_g1_i1.p1 TRINITY_DN3051_c2_g1~~TRINITY_DN3051_c2_g1_i1.p1  ORF type:complete len:438 (+),score=38.19 TRINITY_DN3051_c2_g1_i1:148-1461(+)